MIFEIPNCNLKCWECKRDCAIKQIFTLPEPIFNEQILNSLKSSVGMFISMGGNPEMADTELKKMAITLSISRKEYLKTLKN